MVLSRFFRVGKRGRKACGGWEGEEKAIDSAEEMLGLENVDFCVGICRGVV